MTKGKVGLYTVKGDALTRTHKSCPKCGPGIFLAEHPDRRSCGRCGYSESKEARPAPKPKATKGAPAAPSGPAPPGASGPKP